MFSMKLPPKYRSYLHELPLPWKSSFVSPASQMQMKALAPHLVIPQTCYTQSCIYLIPFQSLACYVDLIPALKYLYFYCIFIYCAL